MERPIVFENEGQQLIGVLHMPGSESPAPGVVLCHGFTGTKAEAHFIFTKLARALAAAGIAAFRFDFRGSGDSGGAFEDMTIGGEISDALRALNILAEQPGIDRERLGILGLSLGGCVAACASGRSDLVKATVLWAPVHDPDVQFARLSGVSYPYEVSGGMSIGKAFVDELVDIDPIAELARSRGPALVLHGSEDGTIPVELSKAFVSAEREVVDGADHTFANAQHERHVIERTVGWFVESLKPRAKQSTPDRRISYADAGVNIHASNITKERLKELVRDTYTPQVLTELGGFGGLFAAEFPGVSDPVLVSSTDGVGTKLKVSVMADRHYTVGMDLLNHCVNDILVMGARPLFFQDYIALGRHETSVVTALVSGIAKACSAVGCALLGGETAEMPDMYQPGEYDLAGTIVGVVERSKILDGQRVKAGDVCIGIASDGLHTNGYSLARRLIFKEAGWSIHQHIEEWGRTVANELLRPHRCYLNPIAPLLDEDLVHAMAHITGGGITDNVPRVLPEGLTAKIRRDAWDIPPVFNTLYRLGNLTEEEALHSLNMGIGMVIVCAADQSDAIISRLESSGERAWHIGEIVEKSHSGEGVRYA